MFNACSIEDFLLLPGPSGSGHLPTLFLLPSATPSPLPRFLIELDFSLQQCIQQSPKFMLIPMLSAATGFSPSLRQTTKKQKNPPPPRFFAGVQFSISPLIVGIEGPILFDKLTRDVSTSIAFTDFFSPIPRSGPRPLFLSLLIDLCPFRRFFRVVAKVRIPRRNHPLIVSSGPDPLMSGLLLH